MVGDCEININEPPPSDKIDADVLHPSDDSMALAIIQPKELVIVLSKELTIMLPKEIVPAPKPKPSMPALFLVSPLCRRRHVSPLKENQVSQRFQHSAYLRSSTFYHLDPMRC
jgi:hypothetical protein